MSVSRREFLAAAGGGLARQAFRPNIIFLFVDDLGFADFGVTGNRDVATPNIDRMAREGTLFQQFYTASPICSPSRAGVLTGQYPSRHRIHSYLSDRKSNAACGMPDWLDPAAPSVARAFQNAGYKTAHFGKWHLGGGRDVADAPLPQAYGFGESWTSFEGLGDRLLIENDNLSRESAALGRGEITWAPKHRCSELYLDRSIDFMRRCGAAPFYLHLWTMDVHDPHLPRPELLDKYRRFAGNPYQQRFYAVLDEFDRQVGRLLEFLDQSGLSSRTLLAMTGDNGPTAWPKYYKEGFTPPGSTGGFRGRKWSLYEGGIRQPLIARWPGKTPARRVDSSTLVSAVDLLPTFCAMAGVPFSGASLDGEDMSRALFGQVRTRKKPLYWHYGFSGAIQPGAPEDRSPGLCVRDGDWKLLMRLDGTGVELYNRKDSPGETGNVAARHPGETRRLTALLNRWKRSLPGELWR
jgi:arylsulfatase A-like enzyme